MVFVGPFNKFFVFWLSTSNLIECIIFFRAINLMDGFLRYSYNYSDSDMYLIGITCIFIASKIEDIYHISI